MFAAVRDRLDKILDAENFIGRSVSQTEEFISEEIDPILDANKDKLGETGSVKV